ncbi:MAG: hypothetical protein RQ731_07925 [Anaerosomatales bacterium]|nr:hypothetical protein [Anaerosomatales bacterium]
MTAPYDVYVGPVGGGGLDGFTITQGTYHRREAPAFIDRFSTGELSHRGDAMWQHWAMSSFRGGGGQRTFRDVEMVWDMRGLDGRVEGELTPFGMWMDEPLAPRTVDGIYTPDLFRSDDIGPETVLPRAYSNPHPNFRFSAVVSSASFGGVHQIEMIQPFSAWDGVVSAFEYEIEAGTGTVDRIDLWMVTGAGDFYSEIFSGSFGVGRHRVVLPEPQAIASGDDCYFVLRFVNESNAAFTRTMWFASDTLSFDPVITATGSWTGPAPEDNGLASLFGSVYGVSSHVGSWATFRRRAFGTGVDVRSAWDQSGSRNLFVVDRTAPDGFLCPACGESYPASMPTGPQSPEYEDLYEGQPCPTYIWSGYECGGTLVSVGARIYRKAEWGEWLSRPLESIQTSPQGVSAMALHLQADGEPLYVFASQSGYLYYSGNPFLTVEQGELPDPLGKVTSFPAKWVSGRPITGMLSFMDKVYVAQGHRLFVWNADVASPSSWAATPILEASVPLTVATIQDGAMYWGGTSGFSSRLFRVDTGGGVEVAVLPDNLSIQSMCSYSGTLMIGASEYDPTMSAYRGRLFRYGGSSIIEVDLRRAIARGEWKPAGGMYSLSEWDGLLVAPDQDAAGVVLYHGPEDAILRSAPYMGYAVATDDPASRVFDMCTWRGALYISAPRLGILRHDPGEGKVGGGYEDSGFTTSVYDGGAQLVDKFWRELVIDAKGSGKILVEARMDPGGSWTALPEITLTAASEYSLSLAGLGLGRRLQLRFTMKYVSGQPLVFNGFYVRYVVEPEVRHSWSFQVDCIDNVIDSDGEVDARTGSEKLAALWSYRETRKPVRFVDLDGTEYEVIVRQVGEYQHRSNREDGLEARVALQLWEV